MILCDALILEIVTQMTKNVLLLKVPNFEVLSNLVIMGFTGAEIGCSNSLSPNIIGIINDFSSIRAKKNIFLFTMGERQ